MEISRTGDKCTFYVDVSERTTLVCPSCHRKKVLDARPYREVETPLRVNCPCGQSFTCQFEYCKNYIKNVDLAGEYHVPKTEKRGAITLQRLSIEGASFTVDHLDDMAHGMNLDISLTLDNKQQTPVERTVKVTSIKDNLVGVMFVGGVRNKTVGFYLMP